MEILNLFLFLLNISNFFIVKSESVILLPLKKDFIKDDSNFEISQLESSKIYTEINVGKPNQSIKLYLNFNYYITYIFTSQANGVYNPSKSLSYCNISKAIYYSSPFEKGFKSNESLFFNTYNKTILEVDNYSFDLVTKIKDDSDLKDGIIGLKLFDNKYRGDPLLNIIIQLKKRHFIESYGWSIKFDKNENGLLSIGAYPHEYDHQNYSTEYFKQILSGWRATGVFWEIEFSNIITGYGNYIESTTKCEMQIETGLIFGTDEYYKLVKKEFFDQKINEAKCYQDTSTSSNYINFKYFYCTDFESVKEFKGIHFKHNDLDKDFFFDYNDLFIKKNNKYYFLIAFRPSTNVNWIIGYPFFKKYEFVFQPDKKLIGTYIAYPKGSINDDDDKNNKKNISIIFLICLVCLLFIVISVLAVFVYKLLKKRLKKKRANELDDNFDYSPPSDDNKIINE